MELEEQLLQVQHDMNTEEEQQLIDVELEKLEEEEQEEEELDDISDEEE